MNDTMHDRVNHPSHYTGFSHGAEVIDITENLNYNRGNAIKYLARAGRKDSASELEDLMKARWYVNREIARLTSFLGSLGSSTESSMKLQKKTSMRTL